MRCELNAFGWLRQDLVYIQIIDRPLRTLNRFSQCALLKRPYGLEYKLYKSFAVYLEHSAQEDGNLKHRISPGACHCSGS